jgi:hypothetical protein
MLGSKNLFPNFGTLLGNAVDSSDPNSQTRVHFSGERVISNDAGLLQELFEQTGTAA